MGRRSHTSTLNVFMNGQFVGKWSQSPRGETFQYAQSWLEDGRCRPISLSLPFMPGNPVLTDKVASYFDNLLPDSKLIRARLGGRYGKNPDNAFDLLEAIGRDCVGALQILPESETIQSIETIQCQSLTEEQVAAHLRKIPTPVRGRIQGEDDLRLSIAGAQEKTALLWHEGRWNLPEGTTPTSHIFKLPLGTIGNRIGYDMSDSVENEWLCAKLCEGFKLPVAKCHIGIFEDQKALVVERFDRALSEDESWIMRLPQEDMCQALGYPSHLKYESEGGPGIEPIMNLLRSSSQAEQDRLNFYRAQFFFWLIAGTDGHAKNFSIALLAGGRYELTPLYDILSAFPIIGPGAHQLHYNKASMAMCIGSKNRHYKLGEILYRHWIGMGRKLGLTEQIEQELDWMLSQVDTVIDTVSAELNHAFPARIAETIFAGMRKQRDKVLKSSPI